METSAAAQPRASRSAGHIVRLTDALPVSPPDTLQQEIIEYFESALAALGDVVARSPRSSPEAARPTPLREVAVAASSVHPDRGCRHIAAAFTIRTPPTERADGATCKNKGVQMNRFFRWLLLASTCIALLACGGGSDGSVEFKISSTSPKAKALDAAANGTVSATFTHAPDAATVTRGSFTLDDGVYYRVGTISVSGRTATFAPSAPLAYETEYTARLTSAIRDADGVPLRADYVWKFKTAPAPDITPPTVSSTAPANLATDVGVNSTLSAVFSEAMDPTSLDAETFIVDHGVTGSVEYAAGTATFRPSAPLAYDTLYTATITRRARDAAGNALEADHRWTFHTGPAPDLTAPTVTSTFPAARASNVAINTSITIEFSEAMDATTMTSGSIVVDNGVSGTVFYGGGTLTLTPSQALRYSTTYTVTIDAAVKDAAGNPMGTDVEFTFTTGANPDQTAPTVVSTIPASGATNVGTSGPIRVTFGEALDPATVNTATFTVAGVSGTVALSGLTATFTPSQPLANDKTYTGTIGTGVKDAAGNSLAAPYVFGFTTAKKVTKLGFRVLDAEYSKALDRIVMVASAPKNQLHIVDPITGTDTAVDLNLAPTSVSVSPNGRFAAVGHNGWISYVDLTAGVLVKTLAVTADLGDVILAGNGYVYAFPRIDQWVNVHSIEIASGTETLANGFTYAGTRGKLHASGTKIYAANNGLSPSDIERYDVATGPASYAYDSPYHGDYAMCGDLWLSEDGARIFTRCGNVFRATAQQVDDMTYNGALPGVGLVRHMSHSSQAGKLLVIPDVGFLDEESNADTVVRRHDQEFYALEESVSLPPFAVGGADYAGHGRFVFFNRAGTKHFVVIQADAASGLLNDFGVVVY